MSLLDILRKVFSNTALSASLKDPCERMNAFRKLKRVDSLIELIPELTVRQRIVLLSDAYFYNWPSLALKIQELSVLPQYLESCRRTSDQLLTGSETLLDGKESEFIARLAGLSPNIVSSPLFAKEAGKLLYNLIRLRNVEMIRYFVVELGFRDLDGKALASTHGTFPLTKLARSLGLPEVTELFIKYGATPLAANDRAQAIRAMLADNLPPLTWE